ncbi:MAG: NAD(P)-dependent oxidoreductase [Candidatus Lambdaproteobacteria bacterium RIFOXYD2_FULL_50_16]|uniref:NAD(P)-dependent oxidoreductase n=1 Tax=Candidatus Lambdaproteobacteria bacterium RIFOXYD2_FULL_50_16 TaxID=1817772 RepID=A0A1F6GF86_9PROT|nr:MAG: NAD(P)-dependent oxidoreductase [Candidatus Lambdaproteobacteria bacterium RIFOXYD2_FULL_50_16]
MAVPLKTILITGAAQGIGRATALLCAAKGHPVLINYLNSQTAANQLAQQINQKGGQAITFKADVADESSVEAMFAESEKTLGPLGGLVNNAGILGPQTTIDGLDQARLERVFAVNVIGSFLCAKVAARYLGSGGAIVNLSSAASRLGSPGEYIDYAASKGAIDSMTLGLAKELAPRGIRVNAVRPGIIDTGLHAKGGEPGRASRLGALMPLGRAGTDIEVAQSIYWLLSSEASYVTGALLDVAGGR